MAANDNDGYQPAKWHDFLLRPLSTWLANPNNEPVSDDSRYVVVTTMNCMLLNEKQQPEDVIWGNTDPDIMDSKRTYLSPNISTSDAAWPHPRFICYSGEVNVTQFEFVEGLQGYSQVVEVTSLPPLEQPVVCDSRKALSLVIMPFLLIFALWWLFCSWCGRTDRTGARHSSNGCLSPNASRGAGIRDAKDAEFQKTLQDMTTERNRLQSEVRDLSLQLENASGQLSRANSRITSLESDLIKSRNAQNNLQPEGNRLTTENAKPRHDLETERTEPSREKEHTQYLNDDIISLAAENKYSARKLQETVAHAKEIIAKRETVHTSKAEADKKVDELRSLVQKAENATIAANNRAEELEHVIRNVIETSDEDFATVLEQQNSARKAVDEQSHEEREKKFVELQQQLGDAKAALQNEKNESVKRQDELRREVQSAQNKLELGKKMSREAIDDLKRRLRDSEAALTSTELECTETQEELKRTQDELKETQDDLEKVEGENKRITINLDYAETNLSNLSIARDVLEKERVELQERVKQLTEQANTAESDRLNQLKLNTDFKQVKTERDALLRQVEDAAKINKERDMSEHQISSQIAKLNKELETAHTKSLQATADLAVAEKKKVEELRQVQAEKERIDAELEELKDSLKELQADFDRDTVARNEEKNKLDAELEALKSAATPVKKVMADLEISEKARKRQGETIEHLQNQLDDYKRDQEKLVAEAKKETQDAFEKLEDAEENSKVHRQTIQMQNDRNARLDEELEELRQKIDELETANKEHEGKLEQTTQHLQQEREQKEAAVNTAEKLEKANTQLETTVEKFKAELRNADNKIKQFENENKNLKAEITQHDSELRDRVEQATMQLQEKMGKEHAEDLEKEKKKWEEAAEEKYTLDMENEKQKWEVKTADDLKRVQDEERKSHAKKLEEERKACDERCTKEKEQFLAQQKAEIEKQAQDDAAKRFEEEKKGLLEEAEKKLEEQKGEWHDQAEKKALLDEQNAKQKKKPEKLSRLKPSSQSTFTSPQPSPNPFQNQETGTQERKPVDTCNFCGEPMPKGFYNHWKTCEYKKIKDANTKLNNPSATSAPPLRTEFGGSIHAFDPWPTVKLPPRQNALPMSAAQRHGPPTVPDRPQRDKPTFGPPGLGGPQLPMFGHQGQGTAPRSLSATGSPQLFTASPQGMSPTSTGSLTGNMEQGLAAQPSVSDPGNDEPQSRPTSPAQKIEDQGDSTPAPHLIPLLGLQPTSPNPSDGEQSSENNDIDAEIFALAVSPTETSESGLGLNTEEGVGFEGLKKEVDNEGKE